MVVLKWYSVIFIILSLIYTMIDAKKKSNITMMITGIIMLLPIIIYLVLS